MQERHFALDDNGPPCNDGWRTACRGCLKNAAVWSEGPVRKSWTPT